MAVGEARLDGARPHLVKSLELCGGVAKSPNRRFLAIVNNWNVRGVNHRANARNDRLWRRRGIIEALRLDKRIILCAITVSSNDCGMLRYRRGVLDGVRVGRFNPRCAYIASRRRGRNPR